MQVQVDEHAGGDVAEQGDKAGQRPLVHWLALAAGAEDAAAATDAVSRRGGVAAWRRRSLRNCITATEVHLSVAVGEQSRDDAVRLLGVVVDDLHGEGGHLEPVQVGGGGGRCGGRIFTILPTLPDLLWPWWPGETVHENGHQSCEERMVIGQLQPPLAALNAGHCEGAQEDVTGVGHQVVVTTTGLLQADPHQRREVIFIVHQRGPRRGEHANEHQCRP